ncbi:MAG: NAD(P)-dependent oxidoreductase [Erysipelotrichaceae bacterium]|nr:NAD(P)-dependent oxidoreductase [Erysipelotrichaceae bacterium]MCD8574905.1 NAD(P)-dependent oxidoreductase [Erysipelotrichaceae bacterium]
MKIAWLGLGLMGSRMVTHLTRFHDVHVYNRTASKSDPLKEVTTVHNSIASCVKDAQVVIMMLSTPDVVKTIFTSEVLPNVNPETIIIDMSTNLPSLTTTLYEQAKAAHLHWVDAPVSGGLGGAAQATLSIMVGGDKEIVKRLMPLLELMGSKVKYCGSSGNGQHTKMANQISVATNLAGLLEAMEYAKHAHLNMEDVLVLINQGAASSWQTIHNGPLYLSDDMSPGFILSHFLKDLRCVMHEANQRQLHLPVVEKITAMVESIINEHNESLSTLALVEYYRCHNPKA